MNCMFASLIGLASLFLCWDGLACAFLADAGGSRVLWELRVVGLSTTFTSVPPFPFPFTFTSSTIWFRGSARSHVMTAFLANKTPQFISTVSLLKLFLWRGSVGFTPVLILPSCSTRTLLQAIAFGVGIVYTKQSRWNPRFVAIFKSKQGGLVRTLACCSVFEILANSCIQVIFLWEATFTLVLRGDSDFADFGNLFLPASISSVMFRFLMSLMHCWRLIHVSSQFWRSRQIRIR